MYATTSTTTTAPRYSTIAAAALFMLAVTSSGTAYAQSDSEVDRLSERIEQLEQQIDSLTKDVKQNEMGLEATGDALEQGMQSAASTGATSKGVTIKGYGELHYNRYDVNEGDDKRQVDFHRNVLFISYRYNDRLRMFTEIELEHSLAGEGAPGEVELEQAYIEYDLTETQQLRGGIVLLPIGFLNETHEPPTFYGVERNSVEAVIIPTTWWAGGIGYSRTAENGLSFDLVVHEGLAVSPEDARIRGGRQKTAEALASNLALTSRLRYTAVAGLELGANLQYQSDITQVSNDGIGAGILLSLHVAYAKGGFGFRALYALWDLATDDGEAGKLITDQGADQQSGFFIEPAYKIGDRFGIFARYEDVAGGRLRDRFKQTSFGFNFWAHEDVVVKLDYVTRKHDVETERSRNFDGINIGFGYQF